MSCTKQRYHSGEVSQEGACLFAEPSPKSSRDVLLEALLVFWRLLGGRCLANKALPMHQRVLPLALPECSKCVQLLPASRKPLPKHSNQLVAILMTTRQTTIKVIGLASHDTLA